MNKVILMGRLTRDPDVRYSGNGESSMTIARFTVAVDRRRTNADGQRDADFIGCVAFGKQAEFAEKYLHQGSKIALTGRIQTGSYNNKDGQKVYTTEVIVEELEFAESKAASDMRSQSYGQNQNYGQNQGYGRAPQYGQQQYGQAPQQSYQQPAPAPQPAPQYQPQPAYGQQMPQNQAPAAPAPQAAAPEAAGSRPAVSETVREYAPTETDDASQVGQGFMNIPEGVEDEGLPFN